MLRIISFVVALSPTICVLVAAQERQPAPSSQPASATVLVLPIAPPQGEQWIGRAIQQDMLADLTQMTRARVLGPAGPPATDAAEALRAGREARADYVVYAQAQDAGGQLRVTGQVLNVETGNVLSTMKATAPADELFPLEDALAVQAARALPQSLAINLPTPQTQPAATTARPQPYAASPPSGPLYESVTTPAPEYYSNYVQPYPSAYPDYYPGYAGWGWWGPGVIILRHGWHDYDHDFGERPFLSPHVHPGFHGGVGRPGFGEANMGTGGHIGGTGHAGGAARDR